MMVSYSNGSLSGEASNKQPLENGYVPKYKPRKVSAIREFPPGCGPNSAPKNLKPEENVSSEPGILYAVDATNTETADAVVANRAGISGVADLKEAEAEAEAVGISEIPRSERNEINDSEVQNGAKNSSNGVECQPHETVDVNMDVDVAKSLDSIVEKVMENVDVSKKLVMEIGPLGVQLPDGVESPRHEAVDNHIEMERDQPLDSYVGKVATTIMNVFLNEVEKSVPETGIKPETSIRPKDKYRPRRVSAIREFPPNCGMRVSLSDEKEKQTMSVNDCQNRTVEVGSALEAAMESNVSERGRIEEVLATSQKGILNALHNFPVENETTEILKDAAARGLLGDSAGGELNDYQTCKHSHIASIGASLVSGTMSEGVGKEIVVCSPDGNNKEGPEQNDCSLRNDCDREIVHGLMAAPYCPWRKSKVDCGTSGQKMRHQDSSRTEKPKAASLNSNLKANYSGGPSLKKTTFPDSNYFDGNPASFTNIDRGNPGSYDKRALAITPISMVKGSPDNSNNDYVGPVGNDIIVYSPGDTDEMRPLHDVTISEDEVDREVVHGLMAAPHCPWKKGKSITNNVYEETSGEKKRMKNVPWRKKAKAVTKRSTPKIQFTGPASKKKKMVHISDDVDGSPADLILADDVNNILFEDSPTKSPVNHKPQDFEVNLPPFGPTSSGNSDARNKVREALRFFHAIYRKLLQQEEAQSKPEEGQSGKKFTRIDLMTAKVLKEKGKLVNPDKVIGPLPGVEVGDEFQYRVELAVVGIHFPYQSGIDSTKMNDVSLATSIVSSGGYSDNLDDADVLIYSGQGGNVVGSQKAKQAEDQKLERGNLALKNCIDAQTPVRVVRGWKESKYVDPLDSKPKMVTTYIYDGLYTVTRCWTEKGPRGKQVFQFELKRNPGQPELAWKELKKSNKFKTRPGTCVNDISGGKELIPIAAVNTLDDEKPPPFNYVLKMMYPNWYKPKPPAGCDCTGRCFGSKKCRCTVTNGGEIPYNRNGALVETKTLVYECGPHCKCPSSCYNRVTQRGIKFKLEIFKTESRGWGVRPLTSIPSGSFICEYAGELLEDKEAEQRIGNDEYLFDIGQNYIDSSKPEEQEIAAELNEGGFTIDACQYGNVGRFINHSCSPNLHAQNVIYDHDDKRMPHIMLFAMENIPPLQELTYHYNYAVDQVHDSDGNIKVKKCYCGSAQCTGRMY